MRLILFDCDGTIVDSQHAISTAMETAFKAHGLAAPERARIIEVVGLSLVFAVRKLIPDRDPDLINAIAETYKDAFATIRRQATHEEPMFPLARETIHALAATPGVVLGIATGKSRRGLDAIIERENHGAICRWQFPTPGVVLGIATGKSRRGLDAIIERENLHRLFETIQTADHHPSKPDPSMVHQAMSETGARPEQTVVIGDTTYDMQMALNARAKAVGVTWGYHHRSALDACGAHALINCFSELPATLDRLLAAPEPAQ